MQLISKGNWKQLSGSFHKLWGRLTGDAEEEFFGYQEIIEGKLEYYRNRLNSTRAVMREASQFSHPARPRGDLVA